MLDRPTTTAGHLIYQLSGGFFYCQGQAAGSAGAQGLKRALEAKKESEMWRKTMDGKAGQSWGGA